MTVYFDQRAHAQKEEEELQKAAAEAEQQKANEQRELAVKAIANLVAAVAKPAVLMLLWNWLMPGIFGLATIGYFKALGLYLISRILFDKNEQCKIDFCYPRC